MLAGVFPVFLVRFRTINIFIVWAREVCFIFKENIHTLELPDEVTKTECFLEYFVQVEFFLIKYINKKNDCHHFTFMKQNYVCNVFC